MRTITAPRACGAATTEPRRGRDVQSAAERALPRRPLELDRLATLWQHALDSAQGALSSAAPSLPEPELHHRQQELARERQTTAKLLRNVANTSGVRPVPWLSPLPVTPQMLGLAASVQACVFDLDGVLTDSIVLHRAAWARVFDDLLLQLAEQAGWHFIPFDPVDDYYAFMDGRPRLEAIHAFLSARGTRLPVGTPDDPPSATTAHGLAKRKSEALARGLRERGVTARTGARRYLEAAGHAGLKRAVVSASTSTERMLDLAALSTLVDCRVDADVIRAERLRSRPAPDVLVAACRHLGVEPRNAVTLTHSPAGVAAGHAAGLAVVGVGNVSEREHLRGFGADEVAASLSMLLDSRLSGDQWSS